MLKQHTGKPVVSDTHTFLAANAAATPVANTLRSSLSSLLILATCMEDVMT